MATMTKTSNEKAREDFLAWLHAQIAAGDFPTHRMVADDEGYTPIVVALASDKMSRVMKLAQGFGGVVNLFVPFTDRGFAGIGLKAEPTTVDAEDAQEFDMGQTVGLFLEHVRLCGSETYCFVPRSAKGAKRSTGTGAQATVLAYQ
jgi:hypothetical protein